MPVQLSMRDVASQGNLYVSSHNKYGGGTIKQGISRMWLDGCRVTNKYLQWLKTLSIKTLTMVYIAGDKTCPYTTAPLK